MESPNTTNHNHRWVLWLIPILLPILAAIYTFTDFACPIREHQNAVTATFAAAAAFTALLAGVKRNKPVEKKDIAALAGAVAVLIPVIPTLQGNDKWLTSLLLALPLFVPLIYVIVDDLTLPKKGQPPTKEPDH